MSLVHHLPLAARIAVEKTPGSLARGEVSVLTTHRWGHALLSLLQKRPLALCRR